MNEDIAAESEDSGEYSTDGSYSLSAAAGLLAELPDDDDDQVSTETKPTEADHEEEGATESDDTDEADDQPDEPEAEAEGETEEDLGFDWEKVPGTAKFNLRDGTTVTAADLKREWDNLRSVRQAQQEFQTKEKEFTDWALQQAQQAQVFEQLIPTALQALQAQLPEIPPMPSRQKAQEDPIGYTEELAEHLAAVEDHRAKQAQIDQLKWAQEQQTTQHKAEQDKRVQAFIANERERLFEAMPDLRDGEKRKAFSNDFVDLGTNYYGFRPEELANVHDHRLILMARDAIAYRKLRTNPPKAKPTPAPKAAPVAQPGRRQAPGEAETVKRQELVKRVAQRGGKVSEVAKLMENI